jgi:hypothetical protein
MTQLLTPRPAKWWFLISCLALFLRLVLTQEVSAMNQASLAQSGYVAELRETVLVIGANGTNKEHARPGRQPCRGGALLKEKKSLLHRLQKPKKAMHYSAHHIRYRLLSAIDGFQKYGERAETIIQTKRDMFQGLSVEQQKVY